MIHSRPGYAPRTSSDHVAKLNDDMIPAINRKSPLEAAGQVDLATKLAGRKLKMKPAEVVPAGTIEPPADIAAAAARAAGPELILNPEPSATPQVLAPGK